MGTAGLTNGAQGDYRFNVMVGGLTASTLKDILENKARYHFEYAVDGNTVGFSVFYMENTDGGDGGNDGGDSGEEE